MPRNTFDEDELSPADGNYYQEPKAVCADVRRVRDVALLRRTKERLVHEKLVSRSDLKRKGVVACIGEWHEAVKWQTIDDPEWEAEIRECFDVDERCGAGAQCVSELPADDLDSLAPKYYPGMTGPIRRWGV